MVDWFYGVNPLSCLILIEYAIWNRYNSILILTQLNGICKKARGNQLLEKLQKLERTRMISVELIENSHLLFHFTSSTLIHEFITLTWSTPCKKAARYHYPVQNGRGNWTMAENQSRILLSFNFFFQCAIYFFVSVCVCRLSNVTANLL